MVMSNVHHIHQQSAQDELILDQASDWIAKIDRELSPLETKAFQRWMHTSPEHMKVMLEVGKMWDKLDELNRLSDVFPKSEVKSKANSHKYLAIAASLILLVSVLFLQPSLSPLHMEPQYTALTTHYKTEVGERNTIHLPDSSVLLLNTNSLVNINYNQQARVIELIQGELHIDVAHNSARPLQVIAGGKVIQAVGTAFNVEVVDDLVELIVTDGKVLVDYESNAMEIQPLSSDAIPVAKGEIINLNSALALTQSTVNKVASNDMTSKLSWRKGNLIFRGDSLAEAIKEISRYTDISFELADDEALRDIKVAGMFKTGDIAALLSMLEKSFNIEHKKVDEQTIMLSLKS